MKLHKPALLHNPGEVEPALLHNPEAVEQELEMKFAKLTLSAWPVYAVNSNAYVQKPRILPDSRGAAVLDDVEGTEIAAGPGMPHNPFKDDIIVYVDPDVVDKMWVGMSIEGVSVQLARVDPTVPMEVNLEQFNDPWGTTRSSGRCARCPGCPDQNLVHGGSTCCFADLPYKDDACAHGSGGVRGGRR